jgi:DNA-binding Lrp family transcriptional regulator
MPESPEHSFLSQVFLQVLDEFSRLELYGYRETERRRFDFSCTLRRDWDRVLVGQTLWAHEKGIDKDLRTLLTQTDVHISAYVVKDTIKSRAAIDEVATDFKHSSHGEGLFKLKLFYVPADFDADDKGARAVVANLMKARVTKDILFNVVFGRLSGHDIRHMLDLPKRYSALWLGVLYLVATKGPLDVSGLARRLQVSSATIQSRIALLEAAGFIWHLGPYLSVYLSTAKGRVFLDLLGRIWSEAACGVFSTELRYILAELDIEAVPLECYDIALQRDGSFPARWKPEKTYCWLMFAIARAFEMHGVDLSECAYVVDEQENDPSLHILP